MKGTRWKKILRQCFSLIHREMKISFTAVPKEKKWVFVVGCYNSGTTLLAEMLAENKQIAGLPTEGQFLTDQFQSDHVIGLPRMWVRREDIYRLNEKDIGPDSARIKKEWTMRLDSSKPIFLEKTPPNCARMRWLQHHFDNAYFIAILRNGYAVAEGISRKAEPIHSKNGWTISESAWQWRRCNEVIEEDAVHLKNFIWIRYENLTKEPISEVIKILNFIGLDNKHNIDEIDFSKEWTIHERSERIRNMNIESFKRLTNKDFDDIERIAGNLLNRYGYKRPLKNL